MLLRHASIEIESEIKPYALDVLNHSQFARQFRSWLLSLPLKDSPCIGIALWSLLLNGNSCPTLLTNNINDIEKPFFSVIPWLFLGDEQLYRFPIAKEEVTDLSRGMSLMSVNKLPSLVGK